MTGPEGTRTAIPLADLPPDIAAEVAEAGVEQVNLYRALAHAPGLLRGWIDFAWALRGHDRTSRQLRELMILRTAALHHSQYEWHQHRRMARETGVTELQVAELEMWRTSEAFGPEERAALALTDATIAGRVPDEVIEELERHFDHAQRVELTVTAAFYAMVPRVLDALGVPVEGRERTSAALDHAAEVEDALTARAVRAADPDDAAARAAPKDGEGNR
jgi:alkylhydroperoxidase family enzyme